MNVYWGIDRQRIGHIEHALYPALNTPENVSDAVALLDTLGI